MANHPVLSDLLILLLWKEVSRHNSIAETAERLAALLTPRLPSLRRIVVFRLDGENGSLQEVAEERFRSRHREQERPLIPLGGDQMKRLQKFAASGRPVWVVDVQSLPPWLRTSLPQDLHAPCWVGPLKATKTHQGLLLLEFDQGRQTLELEGWNLEELLEPFSVALENDWRLGTLEALRHAAETERQQLLRRLGRRSDVLQEEVIGRDGGLRTVFERVQKVAQQDIPVMLLGETGTGKEVVARAIHEGSPRRGGPFVRVNCGAIPPDLIDSELFGHERGSFTGAVTERLGWFEQANHGTLFLDEVGELTPAAQVRLLRVLQEGVLTRVGGQAPRSVDVRVISATHRDLGQMVAQREFREDLWYRLCPFPIRLPPLRERIEDIPELAETFARRAAVRFGMLPSALRPEDVRQLQAYPWPGNVRELQSVIDRAVLLGDGHGLDVAHALGTFSSPVSGLREKTSSAQPFPTTELLETLDDAQRRAIERTLAHCRGRIEGKDGAAALLSIHPNTLRARMKKLGVDWQRFKGDRLST